MQRDDRNFTGSLPDLKASVQASEHQTKVVERNISVVERHFPQMAAALQQYAVGTAKLRDKGDNLSKTIKTYAEEESESLKRGLTNFAECFSAVQDYRDLQASRIEDKLVQGFGVYETKCKQARNDVKSSAAVCSKEVKTFGNLEKAQGKSGDRNRVARAQAEFQKASGEASRSLRVLREQIGEFESQKIRDVKQILTEFLQVEMEVAARALELYTRAYQGILKIQEEEDLNEFDRSLVLKQPHSQWSSAPALSTATRSTYGRSMDNVLEEEEGDDLNRTTWNSQRVHQRELERKISTTGQAKRDNRTEREVYSSLSEEGCKISKKNITSGIVFVRKYYMWFEFYDWFPSR